jgi:hypothetical protein
MGGTTESVVRGNCGPCQNGRIVGRSCELPPFAGALPPLPESSVKFRATASAPQPIPAHAHPKDKLRDHKREKNETQCRVDTIGSAGTSPATTALAASTGTGCSPCTGKRSKLANTGARPLTGADNAQMRWKDRAAILADSSHAVWNRSNASRFSGSRRIQSPYQTMLSPSTSCSCASVKRGLRVRRTLRANGMVDPGADQDCAVASDATDVKITCTLIPAAESSGPIATKARATGLAADRAINKTEGNRTEGNKTEDNRPSTPRDGSSASHCATNAPIDDALSPHFTTADARNSGDFMRIKSFPLYATGHAKHAPSALMFLGSIWRHCG